VQVLTVLSTNIQPALNTGIGGCRSEEQSSEWWCS